MKKIPLNQRNMAIFVFFLIALAFGCGYLWGQTDPAAPDPAEETAVDSQPDQDQSASDLAATEGAVINLNTADYYQLIQIEGIGDKTAREILEFREENGGFNELQDLVTLGLIGQETANKIADKVEVKFP